MCNPHTYSSSTAALRATRTAWVGCQDLPGTKHYIGNNAGVTVGPDHNHPHMFSATDGAGNVFSGAQPSALRAMMAYMRYVAASRRAV